MKVRVKPLKINEDILNAIFNKFPVAGYLAAVSKKGIDKLLIDFTEGFLITRSKTGPYLQPM